MEDAKDFVASLLKTVRDRLGNPLVSAFAIAWLIWNFRVVLVLVGTGEGGWRAKIDYLDKTLMVPSYMWWIHGLAVPLILSSIWIFALPKLLRWVALFHERQGHVTKAAMLAANESEPISAAERTEMWAQMRKRQGAWEAERTELLKVIEDFQNRQHASTVNTGQDEVETQNRNRFDPPPPPPPETYTPTFRTHDPAESVQVWQNAVLLGLRLATQGDPANFQRPRIDFNEHVVLWPWNVNVKGAASLGLNTHVAATLENISLSESDLLVLGALRDSATGRSFEFNSLRISTDAMNNALKKLRSLDMIRDIQGDFELGPPGRLFLAWMVRVGFEFQD